MDEQNLVALRPPASLVVELRGASHAPARRRAVFGAFIALVALGAVAEAGHVLGLGHYRYDPDALRPQLRISERVDDWQFDVSGYPGNPEPGEVIDFRVTINDARGDGPVSGRVEWTIHRVSVLGTRQRVVEWQSGESSGDRFRISLPDDAEYEVTFALREDATHSSALSFPFVVGKPGSPWTILGGFGGGLALFVVGVVIVGRVRDRRALAAEAT